MQAVHELGHVLGAWASGGEVRRVVLSPTTLSRTDVGMNAHPLAVAWAGPIIGVLLPLALWLLARVARWSGAFVLRFFAGFCCVANGLYIGLGAFQRVGDCGEMLRHGAAVWQLWLFGVVVTPVGFVLWNGLGPQFGLGAAQGRVSRKVAFWSLAAAWPFGLGFAVGGE